MPSYNFTIPDSSPYITYSPVAAWGDSDAATASYTNGTFHFTQTPNAFLEFAFNGTGVSLHGAYRANHGLYTVTVDDGHPFTANGGGHGDMFNQTLFQLGGLPFGAHTVKLANTPTAGGYVDLDWAVVEVGDGRADTPNDDIWVDDAVGNWTYDAGFGAGTNNLSPQYFDNTFHAANTDGAKATFSFFGNAVTLYGATSANHGPYTVSLDGAAPQPFNGTQVAFRSQQMMYMASGLPSGPHTVVLTNVGGLFTDVDYAIVSRYGVPQGAGGPTGAPSGAVSASASGSSGSASASGASVDSISGTGVPTTSAAPLSDHTTSAAGTASPTTSSKTSSAGRRSRVGAATLGALALCSLLVAAL